MNDPKFDLAKIALFVYNLVRDISADHNQQGETFKLVSGGNAFLELDGKSIKLCGSDVIHKIVAKRSKFSKPLVEESWRNFIKELGSSFVSLNHLGINYACENFEQEISYYKQLISGSGLSIYEELSGEQNVRWLFIGDTSNWQNQLFEVVLTEDQINLENDWRPHFQIDIDTNLDESSLDKLLTKYFGPDFTQWKMTIPDYGTVLSMGMLASIEGTKIYLGTGTSLRNTKYHREQELKRI
ncbi:MAG: hypothetical protein WCG99_04425 [Candidatus Berkelbacteria bacterium]